MLCPPFSTPPCTGCNRDGRTGGHILHQSQAEDHRVLGRGGQGCLLCPHLLEIAVRRWGDGGCLPVPPTPPPGSALGGGEIEAERMAPFIQGHPEPTAQPGPASLRALSPPPRPKQGQLPPPLLHSLIDLGQDDAQDPPQQLTRMMQEERRPGLRRGGWACCGQDAHGDSSEGDRAGFGPSSAQPTLFWGYITKIHCYSAESLRR